MDLLLDSSRHLTSRESDFQLARALLRLGAEVQGAGEPEMALKHVERKRLGQEGFNPSKA